MKKYRILLLLLCFAQAGIGQIRWKDYIESMYGGDSGIITTIREENRSFWAIHSNDALQSKLEADAFFTMERKQILAINSFDSSMAHFFLKGVNRNNSAAWEYRVLSGKGKIINPWGDIRMFTDDSVQAASRMDEIAYLGGYKADMGDRIIVDVRLKGRQQILYTSVVAWQPVKPELTDIYTSNELNDFLVRLTRFWFDPPADTQKRWQGRYKKDQLDSITGLPKKLLLESGENNLIFYLETDVFKKNQVYYELIKEGVIIRPWAANEFDKSLVWLNNLKPGEYVLKIRFSVQPENEMAYPFIIKTAWYQSVLFKIVITILIIAFIGFIILAILLVRQRQRSLVEQTKKVGLQLEIKAIHAQFNPHFVFNALNSIQGLINKEDIAGANEYLSVFGQLMRNSLANSDKNLIPLSEEIDILETYLKLEQLRFGFNYNIEVATDINVYESEMPSLLLQPLIENAIKHGISGLRENGKVALFFKRNNNDMLVTITDNGKGFSLQENTDGYGLKLTVERIKLLNQVLKEQSIQFEIETMPGTPASVSLTFTNWFI